MKLILNNRFASRLMLAVVAASLLTLTACQKKSEDAMPVPAGLPEQVEDTGPVTKQKAPESSPTSPQNEPDEKQPTEADATAVARKIIYTANLEIQVSDLVEARQKAMAALEKHKGWLGSERQQNSGYRQEVALEMRIPVASFHKLLDELSAGGVYLASKTVTAQDVTEEYVDGQARLNARRALEQQYLQVLRSANKITDILEVQNHLGQVREEIEAMEGRLKYLSHQSSYSTISVTYYLPVEGKADPQLGFFHRAWRALGGGLEILGSFIIGLLTLWPLIVLVVAGVFGYRWWRRRQAK